VGGDEKTGVFVAGVPSSLAPRTPFFSRALALLPLPRLRLLRRLQQKSYLKDSTHFINFFEKMKVPENTILVSVDVVSLYTNIPQEEGINTVCNAYKAFYRNKPPIPK